MAVLFSLAAQKAMQMSGRDPDPVTVDAGPFKVKIPMGGGGLSSVQKNMSINGQPHELSYITPGEGDLLKGLGGSGRMVNGVPAYDFPDYQGEFDDYSDADLYGSLTGLGKIDPPKEGDDPVNLVSKLNLLEEDEAEKEKANTIQLLMKPTNPELLARLINAAEKFAREHGGEKGAGYLGGGETPDHIKESERQADQKAALNMLLSTERQMNEQAAKKAAEGIKASGLTPKEDENWLKEGFRGTLTPEQKKYRKSAGLLNIIQKNIDRGDLSRSGYDPDYADRLEKTGLKTWGKGMRGWAETDQQKAVSREAYDPDQYNLMNTGSGRGELQEEFEHIGKANPNLTVSELFTKFNENHPSLKRYGTGTLSKGDLAAFGYYADKPVGPQVDYMNSARYRGALQGLGMIAKGLGAGPIAVGADMFNEGKGIGSLLADIFEKESGYKIPGRGLYGQLVGELPTKQEMIDESGRMIGEAIFPWYLPRNYQTFSKATGGKVTPLPPIIDPPIPIPIPPDPEPEPEPEPEDTRTPMQKYYNIDPEKDEWYKDEDRKVMEEYYKDFPLDTNPNYTANQLRILAYSYPDLFGNYEPPTKPPVIDPEPPIIDPEPPIDLPIIFDPLYT
jgi:hypothetical protein